MEDLAIRSDKEVGEDLRPLERSSRARLPHPRTSLMRVIKPSTLPSAVFWIPRRLGDKR